MLTVEIDEGRVEKDANGQYWAVGYFKGQEVLRLDGSELSPPSVLGPDSVVRFPKWMTITGSD